MFDVLRTDQMFEITCSIDICAILYSRSTDVKGDSTFDSSFSSSFKKALIAVAKSEVLSSTYQLNPIPESPNAQNDQMQDIGEDNEVDESNQVDTDLPARSSCSSEEEQKRKHKKQKLSVKELPETPWTEDESKKAEQKKMINEARNGIMQPRYQILEGLSLPFHLRYLYDAVKRAIRVTPQHLIVIALLLEMMWKWKLDQLEFVSLQELENHLKVHPMNGDDGEKFTAHLLFAATTMRADGLLSAVWVHALTETWKMLTKTDVCIVTSVLMLPVFLSPNQW